MVWLRLKVGLISSGIFHVLGFSPAAGSTHVLVPRLVVPTGFLVVPPVQVNSASVRTYLHLMCTLRLPPPSREAPLGSLQVKIKPHLHSFVLFADLFSDPSKFSTLYFFVNVFPKGTLLPKLVLCAYSNCLIPLTATF